MSLVTGRGIRRRSQSATGPRLNLGARPGPRPLRGRQGVVRAPAELQPGPSVTSAQEHW